VGLRIQKRILQFDNIIRGNDIQRHGVNSSGSSGHRTIVVYDDLSTNVTETISSDLSRNIICLWW
jgi:hypothetical protein